MLSQNLRAHTAPLFKQQKILPIEKLIQFSSIKFMHTFHFRQLPLSLPTPGLLTLKETLNEPYAMQMTFLSRPIELNL